MSEQVAQQPRSSQSNAPSSALVGSPVRNPYYILATSPMADEHNRVLKHGETFAVFDVHGDIRPVGLHEEGVYHEGTRFLSCLVLRLAGEQPMFLSSTVKEQNDLLAVDLTNADIYATEQLAIRRGTLYLARTKFLWDAACHERIVLRNYGLAPVQSSLTLHFEADFADIFEVRGTRRQRRGRYLRETIEDGTVVLAYEGLDHLVRRARLRFSPPPTALDGKEARFDLALCPKGEATFTLTLLCETGERAPRLHSFDMALTLSLGDLEKKQQGQCEIRTSNAQFDDWLRRATADLHMMITDTPEGPYPYAGVPWFSTAFGRDGIITALEYLWMDPGLARGVLCFLAANQAADINPAQDAEPGKILHEIRQGEMAALGEIPFGRYYGSVDATPLFVMLAGAYFERTGDRALIERLWSNIERALTWIDRYGDQDGDGFVEYHRQSPNGLVQQGWKDSHDSVFHADGNLAQGSIALCEVQGYVFAAKRQAAALAAILGDHVRAQQLWDEAGALQARFEKAFWCEDLSTYALALDGDKRPCRVRTSNAGHCLFTGIASLEHGRRAARTLVAADCFSGWGIRTLSTAEVRYNPMSYHNGSVWPHDNALIALGLARYGMREDLLKVLSGLFHASLFVDLHRLPELYCGFPRRPGEGPTLYPVACAPQSWAAAAVFAVLQGCLGLAIDAANARIRFSYPLLPDYLRELNVHQLRVGNAVVDLVLRRHGHDVGINVLSKEGELEIIMVK
jgi:glycogen debranching enzyme